MANELHEMQFIATNDESPTRIFSVNYDPGRGRDRDLLLTDISGIVIRTNNDDENTVMSLEYIKNDIYLSRSDAARRFEIIGEHVYSGRSWLRVNLIGEPYGVSYSSPVNKNTVLILSMSVYGKEAGKSRLFKNRHETLKRVVESVRVTSSIE
jgi:hypothetical protein